MSKRQLGKTTGQENKKSFSRISSWKNGSSYVKQRQKWWADQRPILRILSNTFTSENALFL